MEQNDSQNKEINILIVKQTNVVSKEKQLPSIFQSQTVTLFTDSCKSGLNICCCRRSSSIIACLELMLFMTVPHDLPVHYYALYATQKVHFILTLVSL